MKALSKQVISAAQDYFRENKEQCVGSIVVEEITYKLFLHDNDRILRVSTEESEVSCTISLEENDGVGLFG